MDLRQTTIVYCLFKKVIPTYSANRLRSWATILTGISEDYGLRRGRRMTRLIAKHQTPMEKTVIANIAIEKDTRIILLQQTK